MRRASLRPVFASAVATAAVVSGLAIPVVPAGVRVVIATALVFVLPGSAVLVALSGRQLMRDGAEAALLVTALSLAIVVAGGLILASTPWGMSAVSWSVVLALITLVFGAWPAWSRWRTGTRRAAGLLRVPHRRDMLLLGGALFVLVGAFALGRLGAEGQPTPRFTQLWMTQGDGDTVHLGVRNYEHETASYAIRVMSHGTAIASWGDIQIAPGQAWHARFQLSARDFGGRPLEAVLYAPATPTSPIRSTVLWPRA